MCLVLLPTSPSLLLWLIQGWHGTYLWLLRRLLLWGFWNWLPCSQEGSTQAASSGLDILVCGWDVGTVAAILWAIQEVNPKRKLIHVFRDTERQLSIPWWHCWAAEWNNHGGPLPSPHSNIQFCTFSLCKIIKALFLKSVQFGLLTTAAKSIVGETHGSFTFYFHFPWWLLTPLTLFFVFKPVE